MPPTNDKASEQTATSTLQATEGYPTHGHHGKGFIDITPFILIFLLIIMAVALLSIRTIHGKRRKAS